jgi:hypothetical protein
MNDHGLRHKHGKLFNERNAPMITPEIRPQMTAPVLTPKEAPTSWVREQPTVGPQETAPDSHKCPHVECSATFFMEKNLSRHLTDCHLEEVEAPDTGGGADYGVT